MNNDEFCYPGDFYWINKDHVRVAWSRGKLLTIASVMCFFVLATVCMIGYYILYPIKYIHNKCEDWCYR